MTKLSFVLAVCLGLIGVSTQAAPCSNCPGGKCYDPMATFSYNTLMPAVRAPIAVVPQQSQAATIKAITQSADDGQRVSRRPILRAVVKSPRALGRRVWQGLRAAPRLFARLFGRR